MNEIDADSLLKRLKLNYELDEIDLVTAFNFYNTHLDANASNDKDRLAIIIHLIMIKENFAHESGRLELNQCVGAVYNKINYNFIWSNDCQQNLSSKLSSNLIVTLLKSGKCVEIHCIYKSFHSEFFKVNLNELFVKKQQEHVSLNFDYLNKTLRTTFVDKCLMGVKSCIKNENLEFFLQTRCFSSGLADLPVEIFIFKIVLKYLNVKHIVRLMQTSKYFHDLLNGDVSTGKSVWFYLLKRDFGKHSLNVSFALPTICNSFILAKFKDKKTYYYLHRSFFK